MIEHFVQTGIINPLDIASLQEEADNRAKKLVFLDTTFVLPTSSEDVYENYRNKRIHDALFFNIKNIADKESTLPHMLPDAAQFSAAISELGIHNDDIIIMYGQHGMTMGPARVWWMFKGFGHDNVIVLNGGLPAWEQAGFKTEIDAPPIPKASHYTAPPFKGEMVVQMSGVINASETNMCPIIDARPEKRFNGKSPEPREGMRSGHMPNAKNLPASSLVNENGMFKPPEELEKMFKNLGVFDNKQQPNRIITTCGSGITACALALALYHLDYKNVSVYDGSWSEWGLEDSPTPVTKAEAG